MKYRIHIATVGAVRDHARQFALTLCAAAALLVASDTAWALSEIKRETGQVKPIDDEVEKEPLPPIGTVPLPDPIQTVPSETQDGASPEQTSPEEMEEGTPGQDEPATDEGDNGGGAARQLVDPDAPVPEVLHDLSRLPEPVRRMRDLILEATKSGDPEKLRPLLGTGDGATQISFSAVEGDPIAFLKELSGDDEGQEILAILQEVLNAGYVHVGAGTPEELYVWPYFFAVPLDKLTAPQKVELFKIVTAGDYEDMKTYGAYIFYRVGITPDGRWQFFVAGD